MSKKKPKNSFSVEEIFKLEEAAANGDKEAEEKLASIDGYEKSSPKQMGALKEALKSLEIGLSSATKDLSNTSRVDLSSMLMPPIEQQQNEAMLNELKEIKEQLKNRDGGTEPVRQLQGDAAPVLPPPDATLDLWFDYMYAVRATGRKITLDDIAEASPFSRSYVGKQHPNYSRRRELKVNKK